MGRLILGTPGITTFVPTLRYCGFNWDESVPANRDLTLVGMPFVITTELRWKASFFRFEKNVCEFSEYKEKRHLPVSLVSWSDGFLTGTRIAVTNKSS